MASLKELRNRIASVTATQKITKAMQMVAAAKLRRARELAESSRPYAERMAAVIANLAAGVSGPGAPKLLVGTGSHRRELVVVATADRGLAGAFNASIVRAARDHIAARIAGREITHHRRRPQGARPAAAAIWRAGVASFEAGNAPAWIGRARSPTRSSTASRRARPTSSPCSTTASSRWSARSRPASSSFRRRSTRGRRRIDLKGAAYEYEPDEETILATLLPRNIATQIFAAMLENQVGFYAAQMAAMDAATRNAGDMIAALTLEKNRTRQAQITKELIEIISGAEAL